MKNQSSYLSIRLLIGSILTIMVISSCDKDYFNWTLPINPNHQITIGSNTFNIGDFYQGGYLFYIFKPGDAGYIEGETHGLVAAKENQGTASWGCNGLNISTSAFVGYGHLNTRRIIDGCNTPNNAAMYCDNLLLDGYDDWFLPSTDELEIMIRNLQHIIFSGFQTGSVTFWSSHQFSTATAGAIHINYSVNQPATIQLRNNPKDWPLRVHAIRRF